MGGCAEFMIFHCMHGSCCKQKLVWLDVAGTGLINKFGLINTFICRHVFFFKFMHSLQWRGKDRAAKVKCNRKH